VHLEAEGPATLETFPVGGTIAEFGAGGFAACQWPSAVVGVFGRGMEETAAGFVTFQIEVEECGDEMLIDGGDAIFAPDGLFKKFALAEGSGEIGRWRIAADVVASVFVDEHASVGMGGLFKGRFDSVAEVRDVVLVASDEEKWDVDGGEGFWFPETVGRLSSPRRDGNDGFNFFAKMRFILRTSSSPIIKIVARN